MVHKQKKQTIYTKENTKKTIENQCHGEETYTHTFMKNKTKSVEKF